MDTDLVATENKFGLCRKSKGRWIRWLHLAVDPQDNLFFSALGDCIFDYGQINGHNSYLNAHVDV